MEEKTMTLLRNIVKFGVILFGLHLFVFNSLCVGYSTHTSVEGIKYKVSPSKIVLTNHDPIIIDGNEDFITQTTAEGWLGDGFPSSPIVIQNISVSTSSGGLLQISNTDLYFLIKNCHFLGINKDQDGIKLINVQNGHIESNLIKKCEDPVYIQNCHNVNFTENIVKENNDGIYGFGTNMLFKDNIISDNNGTGMQITSTTDVVTISAIGNEIRNNNGTGIFARKIAMTGNTIEYNTAAGIIAMGHYNQIMKNNITGNNPILTESRYAKIQAGALDNLQKSVDMTDYHTSYGVGLYLHNAYGKVKYNIIKDQVSHGIVMDCAYYEIRYNHFIDNNLNQELGGSQGYEESSGYENTVSSNFWNDWVSPDNNFDGIVDTPYSLDGSANRKDNKPLVSLSHEVSAPSIIYPSGGETVRGIIEVIWNRSVDNLRHWIKYNLYYSNDSGSSWKLIADDLAVNSYNWNTSSVSDGLNYMIKVLAFCQDQEYTESISNKFTIKNASSTPAITLTLGLAAIMILVIKRKRQSLVRK